MKIQIFINRTFDNDSIEVTSDYLIFYFKSVDSYKSFRTTLSLDKEFEDEPDTFYKLKDILMGLNYKKFKKLFKRVKPIAKYYNLEQDLSNIDIPIIIDLSGLPFTEKIDILTTPSISNKYNLC